MASQGLTHTRPPWLCQEHELEDFIETHNPSLQISQLRRSRNNNCTLVGDILDRIVSNRHMAPPCEWEMRLARTHLAVDLQNIMKRWCGIGLERTLEDSALRMLFSEAPPGPAPEMSPPPPPPPPSSSSSLLLEPGVTKMETAASPPSLFAGLSGQNHYARQSVLVVAQTAQQSLKRPLGTDHYGESAKMCRTESWEFRCPYYTRNQHTHVECADKTFPNPRKLKEHVWRFTKPFKCQTCGKGFGREMTRAIHSQDRKTKCLLATSTYEGSCDYRRDRRIEAAKSTQDIIKIFEDCDNEKVSSPSFSFSTHDEDEEISSPESQSSSTNDSLDEADDSGTDEYMPSASGSCLIPTNDLSHHSPQLCGRVLGDHGRSRQMSLAPDYSVFQRGKSAPPNLPASSSNDFDQPAYGLPTIVVTEAEPSQILSHSTIGGMFDHGQWEGHYLENRMEGASSYGTSSQMYSLGYGAIPPFLFNMTLGTAHHRGGQDMDTYAQ